MQNGKPILHMGVETGTCGPDGEVHLEKDMSFNSMPNYI